MCDSHNHPDNKDTQDVEKEDPEERLLRCRRNNPPGIMRFGPRNGHNLDIPVTEGRREEHFPDGKESPCGTGLDILVEGAGVLPVAKSNPVMTWCTSQVDDKATNNQADDQHDLQRGKDDFGL